MSKRTILERLRKPFPGSKPMPAYHQVSHLIGTMREIANELETGAWKMIEPAATRDEVDRAWDAYAAPDRMRRHYSGTLDSHKETFEAGYIAAIAAMRTPPERNSQTDPSGVPKPEKPRFQPVGPSMLFRED